MSSESESLIWRLQVEMHLPSASGGDLLVPQPRIPALNLVTNLNEPQALQHILYRM